MNFINTYPTLNLLDDSSKQSLSHDLQQALAQSQLHVVYQPQIEVVTRRMVGVEALIRWNHPVEGEISPDTFIPVAEQSNLIHLLGSWILRRACTESRYWDSLKAGDLTLSVHVSPLQLESDMFYEIVKDIVAQTQFNPKQLVLKLTKINLDQDLSYLISAIQRFRNLGVAIALSDGCLNPGEALGCSGLDLLQRLPIDLLKLQRNFIRQIFYNPEMEMKFYAIVNLAKRLNIPFIAEGVETVDQIEFLSWHGCRIHQGYWYARPKSAIELQPWLYPSNYPHS
jgi:EAL domain-containing protein (putative c-di-GMP-specific phosphodiesterase class I)